MRSRIDYGDISDIERQQWLTQCSLWFDKGEEKRRNLEEEGKKVFAFSPYSSGNDDSSFDDCLLFLLPFAMPLQRVAMKFSMKCEEAKHD